MSYPLTADAGGIKVRPERMERERLYHCMAGDKVMLVYRDNQDVLHCYEVKEKELVERVRGCADRGMVDGILAGYAAEIGGGDGAHINKSAGHVGAEEPLSSDKKPTDAEQILSEFNAAGSAPGGDGEAGAERPGSEMQAGAEEPRPAAVAGGAEGRPAAEPAASQAPEPEPEPAASQAPEPEPEPAASQAPETEPEPAASQAPEPEPEPAASQAPETEPEPAASQAPEPEPEPAASQAPEPEPAAEPAASQAPEPEPAASQAPEPEPAASQAPEPEPAASQAPEPEPAASQAPEPEPAASQAPEPEPAASQAPEPEPAASQAPEAEPEPAAPGADKSQEAQAGGEGAGPEAQAQKGQGADGAKPERNNVVFIGQKSTMDYVQATLTRLSNYHFVTITARGKRITLAVDVSQMIVKRMNKVGYKISEVRIGSDTMESEDGKIRNVSTIEIDIVDGIDPAQGGAEKPAA